MSSETFLIQITLLINSRKTRKPPRLTPNLKPEQPIAVQFSIYWFGWKVHFADEVFLCISKWAPFRPKISVREVSFLLCFVCISRRSFLAAAAAVIKTFRYPKFGRFVLHAASSKSRYILIKTCYSYVYGQLRVEVGLQLLEIMFQLFMQYAIFDIGVRFMVILSECNHLIL